MRFEIMWFTFSNYGMWTSLALLQITIHDTLNKVNSRSDGHFNTVIYVGNLFHRIETGELTLVCGHLFLW